MSAVTSNYDSCCAGHAEACCASMLTWLLRYHCGEETLRSDLGVFTGSSLAMLLERYGANCCTERLSDHVIAATGRIFGCRQGSTLPMSPRVRYLKPLQRLGRDTGPAMSLQRAPFLAFLAFYARCCRCRAAYLP